MLALSVLVSSGFVLHLPSVTRLLEGTHARVDWPRMCETEPDESPQFESAASIAAAKRRAIARTSYNAEEEKALKVCRIEFAPYPAGKYNKLASLEDSAAAFDQCRKDLPALKSWSDEEIEATYTLLKVRIPCSRLPPLAAYC